MIGCLRTRVRKKPIIALYFEFETVSASSQSLRFILSLRMSSNFYNLEPWADPTRILHIFTTQIQVILLDFSPIVKAATSIFISGCGSAISSAKEGKSGFIYNLVKVNKLFEPRKRACIS